MKKGEIAVNAIDMTGLKYGELTAIERTGKTSWGGVTWSFSCSCGAVFSAVAAAVRKGSKTSCPACFNETLKELATTHGMSDSSEYIIWSSMKKRCNNKKCSAYPGYGGRGLKVCSRWLNSFESFLSDMGHRPSTDHSIDRLNNDKGYSPSNCRWATRTEQANNRRGCHAISIGGETLTVAQICRKYGVSRQSIYTKHFKGLSGMDLLGPKYKEIEYAGITDTISGWAKRIGMKAPTLSRRIHTLGWLPEKAITQEVKGAAGLTHSKQQVAR